MSTTTELIRGLRARGLSQSEISRRTSIPQPRISRWERGDAPNSADDALKLAALHAELMRLPDASIVGDELQTVYEPVPRCVEAQCVATQNTEVRDAA